MIRRGTHSSSGGATPRFRVPTRRTPDNLSRLRWGVAFVVIFGGLVWVTGSLLSVLVASAVLAYLIDPVVSRIQARGHSRERAIVALSLLAGVVLVLLAGIVVPSLARKVGEVGSQVSPYIEGFSERVDPWITTLESRFGVAIPTDLRELASEVPGYIQKLSPDARKAIQDWMGRLAGGGLEVVLSVLTVTLLPVFTFYLLRDWPVIVGWVDELVPMKHRPAVRRMAVEIDGRIGSFVKGQLTVAAILSAIYTVGLLVAGLDLALTMGLLSGALFLLPYLGPAIAATLSIGLALLEHGFDWHVLVVAGTFGLGQFLENTFLTPMLVGDRVGLHPLIVMIALIVAGNLFGVWGLVVALPVTAALAVVGSELLENYRKSRTFLG